MSNIKVYALILESKGKRDTNLFAEQFDKEKIAFTPVQLRALAEGRYVASGDDEYQLVSWNVPERISHHAIDFVRSIPDFETLVMAMETLLDCYSEITGEEVDTH